MNRSLYHVVYGEKFLIATTGDRDFPVWEAILEEGENNSGQLSFKLSTTAPEAQALQTMLSEISVEDDGREIWRGRIVKQHQRGPLSKEVTVKGCLDYLYDSFLRPGSTLSGSRAEVLRSILISHNEFFTETHKMLYVGEVADDGDTEINIEIDNPRRSWDVLSSAVKEHGGILRCRRSGDCNLVDWLSEKTEARHQNSQGIILGENLLGVEITSSGDNLATAIYGFGKKTNGIYLTVESVNSGSLFVSDPEAVAMFSFIAAPLVESAIEDPDVLLARMREDLRARLDKVRTVSASAFDRSDLGEPFERFAAGDSTSLVIPYMSLSENVNITKIRRNLFNPTDTKITLGADLPTASRLMKGG